MTRFNRRTVLLSSLGSALIQTADNDQASAQGSGAAPATTDHDTLVPTEIRGRNTYTLALSDVSIDLNKEVNNWSDLVARIVASGYDISKFNVSYEEGVLNNINNIKTTESSSLTHYPRLVEPLLGEISSLINRCLAYRREGAELEIAGVAAGAARLISDALDSVDREVASIDLPGIAAGVLSSNYKLASDAYKQLTDAKLAAAKSLEIYSLVLANSEVEKESSVRNAAQVSSLQFRQSVERQLMSRINVPGNAHNYVERFELVRTLFESDVAAAYRRALAVAVGLEKIFLFNKPVPIPKESGFIDELLIWTREAMRAVTRVGEVEIELSKAVDVVVQVSPPPGNPVFNLYVDFPGLTSVRLRSIAASFYRTGSGNLVNDNISNSIIGMSLVKTPTGPAEVALGYKQDQNAGPAIVAVIPAIRQWSPQSSPASASGSLLYNVNPIGTWAGRLNFVGRDGTGQNWSRGASIVGLLIEMRVVAVVDASNPSWVWIQQDMA